MKPAVLEGSSITGWGDLNQADQSSPGEDVCVVGVPFDGGGGLRKGAAMGPERFRLLSRTMKTINPSGYDFSELRLRDLGDICTKPYSLEQTVDIIGDVYADLFSRHKCPILTLGGDHSITFPIVRAAAGTRSVGVLWFDAHPDLLDTYRGSQLSHGCPMRRILCDGGVRAENVMLIGTRAYDRGEPEFIKRNNILEFRATAFHSDLHKTISDFKLALDDLTSRVDSLYVSVDLDVLDDIHVPGASTPVSNGLSLGLLLQMLAAMDAPVIGYDVVEFAHIDGIYDVTARTAMAVVTQLLSEISIRS